MAYDFRAENKKEADRKRSIKRVLERGGRIRVRLVPAFEEFWEEDGPTYTLEIAVPEPKAVAAVQLDDGRFLYSVTPSSKEPGRYQITWFEKSSMEPFGDTQRSTWEEAISYALQERAVPTEVVLSSLAPRKAPKRPASVQTLRTALSAPAYRRKFFDLI